MITDKCNKTKLINTGGMLQVNACLFVSMSVYHAGASDKNQIDHGTS